MLLYRKKSIELFLVFVVGVTSIAILFVLMPLASIFLFFDPSLANKVLFIDPNLSSEARSAFITAFVAASVSTLILMGIGIPTAYVLAKIDFPFKRFVEGLIDVPLVIPHAVAGIMILLCFGSRGLVGSKIGIGIEDSFWGIVAVMSFVSLPLMVDSVKAGFRFVDVSLEAVARTLGANKRQVFMYITLPIAFRTIITGAILSWARAMSEVGALLIVAYYPKTINVLILEWFNIYGLRYAVVLSVPLIVIALLLFIVIRVLGGRS